jgi:prepilin-type N-terminal cleavage/methylation domain-containing protein
VPGKKWSLCRGRGFTLIELMVVIVIIGILAAFSMAKYSSAKEKFFDASMKSDLKSAMMSLEDYRVQFGELPSDLASFEATTGFQLSPDVSWSAFTRRVGGGGPSILMRVSHPRSSNTWQADYPTEGSEIERQGSSGGSS